MHTTLFTLHCYLNWNSILSRNLKCIVQIYTVPLLNNLNPSAKEGTKMIQTKVWTYWWKCWWKWLGSVISSPLSLIWHRKPLLTELQKTLNRLWSDIFQLCIFSWNTCNIDLNFCRFMYLLKFQILYESV